MAESLKDKTVKGTLWSGLDNVAQIGVTFIVSIVLARLLSPDDYGLLGIIAVFTAVCTAMINGGFATALIRKKDATDDDYNTSFIVNLGLSLFFYVIIYFSSPFIATFFNREELVSLTRVASLGMIIGALALVQQTRLTKRIDFKTQTKITIIASVASGGIGITMALLGFGVWSLVAQKLSSYTLRTILLLLYNRWVPQLRFSSKSFHELFGFGWKIMASEVLNALWKELYQVVVGKFYSPATLGQYSRAHQFSKLFSSNLNIVVQRVTYPVLSSLQDDKERLIASYRRVIKVTMFITAISMLFLAAVSEPLIYCLIGSKWNEAAIYLPLICLAGSSYPLQALNLNMLQVQGRSDIYLGIEIAKKIIAIIPLVTGALVGILPMLYVNIIISIICYFLNSSYSGRLLGYSSWKQINDIAPSYGIAVMIGIPVYFLKFLPLSFWIIFPLQLIFGVLLFFVCCKVFNPMEYNEIRSIVKVYLNKVLKYY